MSPSAGAAPLALVKMSATLTQCFLHAVCLLVWGVAKRAWHLQPRFHVNSVWA